MYCIHSYFPKELSSNLDRLSKNLTHFSAEKELNIQSDKYTNFKFMDLTSSYIQFKNNAIKLKNGSSVAVIPPFCQVAEFYENFCKYIILRFEGKRKYYRENYPDMDIRELSDFIKNYKGNKEKVLIEISGMCKDCNLNKKSFTYMTLNQGKLKQYISGAKEYFSKETNHNYYTYSDEKDELHIVWLEDNTSISLIHNFIKEKKVGGIHWKNPANVADGNWEAMKAIFSHL